MDSKRGKFIVIEGPDGSGKGTVIEKLKERFPEIVYFREPGGTEIGEEIRKVLLNNPNFNADPMTEALLFYAVRNENLVTIVGPALKRGKNVIADRFSDSTEVYEFRMNGCNDPRSLNPFYRLDELVVGDYQPDLVIYLDVSPEEAVRRINKNSRVDGQNRFDLKPLKYHQKVRKAYFKALRRRCCEIIDTNSRRGGSVEETIERVCGEAVAIVAGFLRSR